MKSLLICGTQGQREHFLENVMRSERIWQSKIANITEYAPHITRRELNTLHKIINIYRVFFNARLKSLK